MKEKDGGRVVLERTTMMLQLLESRFNSEAGTKGNGKGKGFLGGKVFWISADYRFRHSVLYLIKKYTNQECDRPWDSGQHG